MTWEGKKMICDEVALLFPTFITQKDQEGKRKKKQFIRVIRYFYKDISFTIRKTGSVSPLPIQDSI